MKTIFPEQGRVLRNTVNGVFSFMANTSHPENWENVDLAEYEAWQAAQEEPDLTADEALDIILGGAE